jgi:hypothetical protein
MSSLAEGDWGPFTFKLVEPSYYQEIREYLNENFYRDEPLKEIIPADDSYPEFANERIIAKMDEYKHLCFMALDRESGEIAGLQLQFKWTKVEARVPYRPSGTGLPVQPTRKIMDQVFAPLEESKVGIFDKFGVESAAWNFLTSTGRKFRRKGLASEMYRRMVDLLKEEGFSVVFSVFSSPYSRRCAEKTGFIEIDRVIYTEVKDGEGKLVIPNATHNNFAALMVMKM